MSGQETISKHEDLKQSIFTRASEDLKKAGFDSKNYWSWEAACRLIRVLDWMGFAWTTSSWNEWRFRMKLAREIKPRGKTKRTEETLIIDISVQLSPRSSSGFTFEIPDAELKAMDTKENHLFVFVCVIEDRITYFTFPHRKIQREIERNLPRTQNDDGWRFTINIEEYEVRIEELDDSVTKRRALIVETGSNVTYYANNFRSFPYETGMVPIIISRDLEELFLENVPDDIITEDVTILAWLPKLSDIIEKRVDDDEWIEAEEIIEPSVDGKKRKSKKNKK